MESLFHHHLSVLLLLYLRDRSFLLCLPLSLPPLSVSLFPPSRYLSSSLIPCFVSRLGDLIIGRTIDRRIV